MKSLFKRFEVLTVEQEVFWLLLFSGVVLVGVLSWAGYRFYQAQPCGCVPGGDNTEKVLPGEKVVGHRFVSSGFVGYVPLLIRRTSQQRATPDAAAVFGTASSDGLLGVVVGELWR